MTIGKSLLMAGAGLHPLTRAYIAAMTVKPSAAAARGYDKCIRKLVKDGLWSKLDILSGMPTHDAQSSCINVVNPGTDDFTSVTTGAPGPVFTPFNGWQVPTGSGYLIGQTNMSALTQFQDNSAHFGVYSLTNNAATQVDVGVPQFANTTSLNMRDAGNNLQARINWSGTAWAISGRTTSIGHACIVKSAINAHQAYFDGALLGNNTSSLAGSRANLPFGMLATAGAQSRRLLTAAHCGSALTATEVANLYAAISQLISDVSAL